MLLLPEPLRALVEQLSRLPGLGPKSALRCAMVFLKWPEAETRRLGQGIYDLRSQLHLCSQCGAITQANPCAICLDPNRDDYTLCLVADWDSMLTLEKGGFYNGRYLILGGLLAPLENVTPDSLELGILEERLNTGTITEIILALGATIEAENTASYIAQKIKKRFAHISISRLAQGIPLGAEVKFMDQETLRQSLKHRQPL